MNCDAARGWTYPLEPRGGEPTPCDSAFVSAAEPAEQPKRELDAARGRAYPLKSLAAMEAMAASEYLSASRVCADIEAANAARAQTEVVGTKLLAGCDRAVLVGCGGSYAALLTAQYLLDTISAFPVHVSTGTDLVWRQSKNVGPRCAVILVSYSGETTDVVEALAVAKADKASTLGITGTSGSTLDTECDESIVYAGNALYEVPVLLIVTIIAALAQAKRTPGGLLRSLDALADALDKSLRNAPASMRAFAEPLASADHLYVLGTGPLSALGYKLSPVLMENVRIGSTYFDTSEFRHGPIEFLERNSPTIVGLLGTDSSRELAAGVLQFIRDRGGDVHVIDAADYVVPHPLLAPLVLNSVTQWFVGWLALRRGIDNLDARVYMGKGLLSAGKWP